jgi:hypothetical protein
VAKVDVGDRLAKIGGSERGKQVVQFREGVSVIHIRAENRQNFLEPALSGTQHPRQAVARDILTCTRGQALERRLFGWSDTDLEVL